MSMPSVSPDPGQLAQVLLKLGEMGIQLAHIEEQLKSVADHEMRIRSLERWKYGLPLTGLTAAASIAIAVYSVIHH